MIKKLLLLIIFSLGLYFVINKNIGSGNLNFISNIIPIKYHENIKKILFPYKYNNEINKKMNNFLITNNKFVISNNELVITNNELEEKNEILKKKLKASSLTNTTLIKKEIIKINNQKYIIKKFSNKNFLEFGPRSYISSNDSDFFLITGSGMLFQTNLNNLSHDNLSFSRIETNIRKFISDDILTRNQAIVNDLLIDNDKILISLVYQNKKCYENLLIIGNINYQNIKFEKKYITEECNNNYSYQAGNRIIKVEDNYILSIGDFDRVKNKMNGLLVQNDQNILGKLILIDKENKPKIIAKGLRNSQGLFYDKENNIIFISDHGPYGGDEINKLFFNKDKIVNFGWPLASYGEHYDEDDKKLLKLYPLYKSHKNFGFEEPIHFFNPSVGPSQLIRVDEQFMNNSKNSILLATMKDLSLHFFKFDENYNKVLKSEKIYIDERIRDLEYIKKHNLLVMFLETSGSISVIKKEK